MPEDRTAATDAVLPSSERRAEALKRFARLVGIGAAAEGVLVLVGWALDVSALRSVIPGLATMKPITALALAVAGFCLRQQAAGTVSGIAGSWARVGAILVVLIGGLTVLEYWRGVDLGIDLLLFRESVLTEAGRQHGRMAPSSAASLLLLGIALLLADRGGRSGAISQACSLAVALGSLVALIGYVYGAQSLDRFGGHASVAVHTAATLLLLSFGLSAAHPERSLLAIVVSDGPGGRAARELLPLAAFVPLVLGWIRLAGQAAGLYETTFGTSLMVLALIAVFCAMILRNARSLDRLEADRRRAEDATREKSRTLELVLDHITDGVVASDSTGRFVVYNRAAEEILGVATAAVAPAQWSEHFGVFHADATTPYPASELPLARAMRGEMVNDVELVVRHSRRPESAWLRVSGRPLQDPEGRLEGGIALFSDITERRRLDEARRHAREMEAVSREAQESSRLKSEFLANMSHELRTPLNAMIGFTELLHDGKVGAVSGEQKELLADILTSSRHLLQLINDILDLSKVEAGRMEFHPERVEMAELVGEVREVLRSIAAGRRIRMESQIDPGLGDVVTDPGKLKQVLYNYLSNALKFTPEEGRVTVRVAPEGADRFRLEVEDTGIGIRPEDLKRLFVEFQQLDASSAKKHAGTGLGLALAKRLVEAQGGRVEARSMAGQGSTFSAILPRIAPGAQLLAPQ